MLSWLLPAFSAACLAASRAFRICLRRCFTLNQKSSIARRTRPHVRKSPTADQNKTHCWYDLGCLRNHLSWRRFRSRARRRRSPGLSSLSVDDPSFSPNRALCLALRSSIRERWCRRLCAARPHASTPRRLSTKCKTMPRFCTSRHVNTMMAATLRHACELPSAELVPPSASENTEPSGSIMNATVITMRTAWRPR